MTAVKRILIVDDRAADRELAAYVLSRELPNAQVCPVGDALAFATELSAGPVALMVCELSFSWGEGDAVVSTVKRVHPECRAVLFTAPGSEALVARALQAGADAYVEKGSDGFLRLPKAVRDVLGRGARGGDSGHYRELVERLPVGVFGAAEDGRVVVANGALARLLGYDGPDALRGRRLADLFPAGESGADWAGLLAGGRAIQGQRLRARRADGTSALARIDAWRLPEGDEAIRVQGAVVDLGEVQAAEERAVTRVAALEESNAELEQFAYVVSHDLQQPLHIVARYARMLSETCGGNGDENVNRYLRHLLASTSCMQEMVDDVLAYSRVGTRGRPFEDVPFDDVMSEALANLRAAIEESGAEVECEPLPTLRADRSQMVQLFLNLVGNAIKFRGDDPPRVRIAAREGPGEWDITVQDNGIGIDPENHERIFEMFQRLHTESEFPGTGIGLAICRKVARRHGGTVWVESEPGRGATFHVTIAKQHERSSDGQETG